MTDPILVQMTEQTKRKALKQFSSCEYLAAAVKQHGICPIEPTHDRPFDALISSIISQQLSVKAAYTIEQRVRGLVGKTFRPANILKATTEQLRSAGLSGRKTEYVQGIAQAVQSRQINFKQLQQASDQEVIDALVQLRGVGQWTAEMFMIFALGRVDVFSKLDLGLQRAMKIIFGNPQMSLDEMANQATRWQPYRSIACWYLWRISEATPMSQ